MTQKISRKTQVSILTERLRDDIIKGEYRPGTGLSIAELSKHYQVSHVPIREALSRLSGSGLIVSEDQRGFRVTRVSVDKLRQIVAARIYIEAELIRKSMAYGDVEWESRLVASLHRLKNTKMIDPAGKVREEWESAHREFHCLLLAGSEERVLYEIALKLSQRSERYRYLSINIMKDISIDAGPNGGSGPRMGRGDHKDIQNEHEELTEAVIKRDERKALALLEEHYNKTMNIILCAIDSKKISA